MYDAVKAIEVKELKKKLESVGGSYEFEDHYLFIDYYDSDGNTYIPERCVETYNKEYGEDIEPFDIDVIG